jgi:acetyl/propionyl-CoA carboxylase alpha subunit
VKAVKVSHYTNAGTVEFMVDKNKNFYFLEMNTRLQVEHPVTELITGIDIVKEQFHVASGEKLSLTQDTIAMNGAAIECRISAEDPENDFAPSTGRITKLIEPGGPGVRVETGVYEGFEVPIYYDPLIAKLLVWAPMRQKAIVRMKRALGEIVIRGIKTSIPFHIIVMDHPRFIAGDYDTTFIDKVLGKIQYKKQYYEVAAIAVAINKIVREQHVTTTQAKKQTRISQWKLAGRQSLMKRL